MEKERRTKALVAVVLLIVVAGLTVAFAALSSSLNINGTAYLDAAKWGIKFENLSEPDKIGTATTTGTAKIEETKSAEITGINVGLLVPGDKVTYTVDLVNEGTINAKIDKIEKTTLTEEQQKYLKFRVTDKDYNEVREGDILSKGERKNLIITIEFIKDLTKEDLPTKANTISLSYKLNFVQTDDNTTTTNNSSQQACTSFDKKDTYSVGDVIALCNTTTNKSEDFYVIKDNGDTVEALAKYNLLIGNTVVLDESSGSMTTTPISSSEEGYGLQNSIAGYYEFNPEGMLTTNTFKGVIAFAEDKNNEKGYWVDDDGNLLSKYGTSYPANVFDSNSLLYEPLENYKNYLRSTLGKTSVATKLITREGLISLGCNNSCTSAPSWVYSTNYRTASAYDNYYVWNVYSNGGTDGNPFDIPALGLRPVITISKSEL